MPELPDLAVVADALHAALAGRSVVRAEAPAPLAVRGTPAELAAPRRPGAARASGGAASSSSSSSSAIGSRSTRCSPAASSSRRPATSARRARRWSWRFGPRASRRRRTPRLDARARRGCRPTTRRPRSATATRARWARSTCCPPASRAPVAGLEDAEQGPDADDPELTLEVWRERIRRHPGELKSLLRNQAFVAGIGNAYSDEILHAAKLSPFRRRSSLAPEEVDALYEATRTTLARAIDVLRGARAADVREAGPRLPRRPPARRRGLPALRHAAERGQLAERGDDLVPGLPALSRARPARVRDLAGPARRGASCRSVMPLRSRDRRDASCRTGGDRAERVADLTRRSGTWRRLRGRRASASAPRSAAAVGVGGAARRRRGGRRRRGRRRRRRSPRASPRSASGWPSRPACVGTPPRKPDSASDEQRRDQEHGGDRRPAPPVEQRAPSEPRRGRRPDPR